MKKSEQPKKKTSSCFCPYCDAEIALSAAPVCQACEVTLRYCVRCQIAVPRDADVCPKCGSKLEWK